MNPDITNSHRSSILLGDPVTGEASTDFVRKSYNLDSRRDGKNKWKLQTERGKNAIYYEGDSHLMTVAPTGSGKGRSAIIPNLLTYDGPIVVIDPKGENYSVTANARRAMGQAVFKLDPFSVLGDESDSLNPLDIFDLENAELETDAQMIADLLSLDASGVADFWDQSARGLLSGVIAMIAGVNDKIDGNVDGLQTSNNETKNDPHPLPPPLPDFPPLTPQANAVLEPSANPVAPVAPSKSKATEPKRGGLGEHANKRNFSRLLHTLHSDDVVYNLAVILDTIGGRLAPMAYGEIAAFLQKADKERSGVLSTASTYLKGFFTRKVLRTLDTSSFELKDIVAGKPISVFLIIPPDKLKSHKAILRIWIGTIMKAITSRKVIPKKRTLFVLDECAQLGPFPFLESAITLCRGYGLQTWTFWQDLSQIENLYKVAWATMVNNCAVLQFFGTKNFKVASQLADLIGIDYEDIRELDSDHQIVVVDGVATKLGKVDYLKNKRFKGKFDNNPYYL